MISLTSKNTLTLFVKKLSRSSGVLKRLSYTIPCHALKTIYMSLIYPYLMYGVECWGSGSKTGLNQLCSIQNRCVRLLSGNNVMDVAEIYRSLKLFPFVCIYKYFIVVKFFKYFVLQSDSYFSNKVAEFQVNHRLETRFRAMHCLNCPFFRKSRCQSSFIFQSVQCWNEIPNELRLQKSLVSFKRLLRLFLL